MVLVDSITIYRRCYESTLRLIILPKEGRKKKKNDGNEVRVTVRLDIGQLSN